jgi:hypothetical protein
MDAVIPGHHAEDVRSAPQTDAPSLRRATTRPESATNIIFGSNLVLDVGSGGMHVIGRVLGCRDDAGLVACVQRAGLAPFPPITLLGRTADRFGTVVERQYSRGSLRA